MLPELQAALSQHSIREMFLRKLSIVLKRRKAMSRTTLLSAVLIGTLMLVGREVIALDADRPEHQDVLCCHLGCPEKSRNADNFCHLLWLADQREENFPGQRFYPRTLENFLTISFGIPQAQIFQWTDEIVNDDQRLNTLHPNTQDNLREYVRDGHENNLEILRPLLLRVGRFDECRGLATILESDEVSLHKIPVYKIEGALLALYDLDIDVLRWWEQEILGNPDLLQKYRGPNGKLSGPLAEIDRSIKDRFIKNRRKTRR
jgi:hypothetical protein